MIVGDYLFSPSLFHNALNNMQIIVQNSL
jgi:hypothetical protein